MKIPIDRISGRGSACSVTRDKEAVALLFTESVHCLAGAHYDVAQRAAWAPRPPDLDGWVARLATLKTLVDEADIDLAAFISYEQSGHIDHT